MKSSVPHSAHRVSLVTNIVPPYRIPVWTELQKLCGHLDVIAFAEREPNRIWTDNHVEGQDFQVHVLSGLRLFLPKLDAGLYFNPKLWATLRSTRPDTIIITGYENLSYLTALAYAELYRIPVVLWWGSHKYSGSIHSKLLELIKRKIFSRFDSYVTYGTLSTEYLLGLGLPGDLISTGFNTVDVEQFQTGVQQMRTQSQPQGAAVRFLYVGQLIERKGVEEMLDAFALLDTRDASLVIVGYGELKGLVQDLIEVRGLSNVTLAPPTRRALETMAHYAEADILILPSISEVWGLVANEAIASGLDLMVSRFAGASTDFKSYFPQRVTVFDPTSPAEFAACFQHVITTFRRQEHPDLHPVMLPASYAASIYQAVKLAHRQTDARGELSCES